MVQTPTRSQTITPFDHKLDAPLTKQQISVLQVNLGKRCNLACSHCHVEAGPKRTEEISRETWHDLVTLIEQFPQIKTLDLTGGAPEMHEGFKPLVEAARANEKEVIVRSNLTIYFVPGYNDMPEYFAQNQLRVVASLPCYLADNVDKMRGNGVFDESIRALQWLNQLGYGRHPDLSLDLVYNPPMPWSQDDFRLPPDQKNLEAAYKAHLGGQFGVEFNNLLTITNLPIGRTKQFLQRQHLHESYTAFLEANFNSATVAGGMCRNQLSVDYLGNIYDCDFNQMEGVDALAATGERLTVRTLLQAGSLDVIEEIQTRDYCYGCTAGCGSSCGGALTES
jgi:radical SAM/Cys-rich protein